MVDDGANFVRIPDRNVFIYNNVLYNRAGHTAPQIFTIFPPYEGTTQNGSNVPVPARADANLQIRGNVIFNGGSSPSLGIEDDAGCLDSNPTCNASQLRSENSIGIIEPVLVNPGGGDFRPAAGSALLTARTFSIPSFGWNDAPSPPLAPAGDPSNAVTADRDGRARTTGVAGAYTAPGPKSPSRRRAVRHESVVSLAPLRK